MTAAASSAEERLKHLAALRQAIPVTRMVDYGVPLGDALAVHAATTSERPVRWDDICEEIAFRHVRLAKEASGETAAQAWRSASALLQCAQLAFNVDEPRKQDLYERANAALSRHAALRGDVSELELPTPLGNLRGWTIAPQGVSATGAVVLLGGLSGWGGAYLDMGRALAARGLLAVLGEGPGQGLTRMQGGVYLDASTLPLLSRFVDFARDKIFDELGVGAWGNSFGGLFAARLAVGDSRVQAVCINGAPMTPTIPGFRTAREQMIAVFGLTAAADLARRLADLALSPSHHRTDAAMLIVEGGNDALVPLGSQDVFFSLSKSAVHSKMTWPDGEHTIYNHAQERNGRIADWFVQQLRADGP